MQQCAPRGHNSQVTTCAYQTANYMQGIAERQPRITRYIQGHLVRRYKRQLPHLMMQPLGLSFDNPATALLQNAAFFAYSFDATPHSCYSDDPAQPGLNNATTQRCLHAISQTLITPLGSKTSRAAVIRTTCSAPLKWQTSDCRANGNPRSWPPQRNHADMPDFAPQRISRTCYGQRADHLPSST